jgi:2-polyprenyl-3-methyl-5-hydroxy-6-metoxy-1,4-benzoquinol methylase
MRLIQTDYNAGYHERFLYHETQNSPRNQARLKLIREFLPAGRLLEIGCGQCGFLALAEEYFSVEGMDLALPTIPALRDHFAQRLRAANIEQAQLPPAEYDVIAAFNILEHLHDPAAAAAKIHRALRPGGRLIGSVPFNSHLAGRLITRIGNFVDRTHVSTFPPHTWRHLFTQAGFQQVLFFGELNLGRNRCHYLRSQGWEHLALNLMFVCV